MFRDFIAFKLSFFQWFGKNQDGVFEPAKSLTLPCSASKLIGRIQ